MDKKACIFDMDGTLVDSMGYWRNLGREYLRNKGVTGDLEEILARTDPMTMEESAELFRETFGLEGTAASISEEILSVMDYHYRTDVPLKPGVREYLDALKAAGVKMAVATATPEDLARLCLERLGVAEDFVTILSCDAVSAGKDRPDVFLEAARLMETAPADTAVFEDAGFAGKTAKEAGFYVVAVYDESNQGHWPELSGLADEIIVDWAQARPFCMGGKAI